MDRARLLIRHARPDEAESLSELAMRSKAYWGYDAAFMEACRPELTVEPDAMAANPTFVLEDDGRLVGFYALEAVDSERMELALLFVEPACIGRGYGRTLLDHAKTRVRAQGCSRLVIQSDPHAVAFYEAAGGRIVSKRAVPRASKEGTCASARLVGRELPVLEIDAGR